MTTIAKLVTALEADPRGLTRGLQQGAADVRRFTDLLKREVKNLPALNIVTPTHFNRILQQTKGDLDKATEATNRLNRAAEGVVASMTRMRAHANLLRDDTLRGSIAQHDPFQTGNFAAFSPSGPRGGAASAELLNLRKSLAYLHSQVGPAGFQMGQSLARHMSQGFAQGNAVGNIRKALGVGAGGGGGLAGLFNASGPITRTQGALLSVAFTLGNLGEQLATADTKWQKLDRTIGTVLQTAASVAVFFGPGGIVVAAIATALNFLSSFWTQQREEIDKTAKAMEDATKRMIDAGETAPMIARVAAIEQGPRSAGLSKVVPGAYAGGLLDLEAQLRDQETALRTANFITVNRIQDSIADLKEKIAPLKAERDRLIAGILDPTPQRGVKGAIPVSVSAAAPKTAEESITAVTQQTQELLSLQAALIDQQMSFADVNEQIGRNQIRLNKLLDAELDKRSKIAIEIRKTLADIAKADPLANILRENPRSTLPTIGTTPAQMKPVAISIPELEKLPVTLGQQMKLAFQPLIDAIGKMGDFLLNAGLSLLSKYGGAGGQAIAGIASGAMAGFAVGGPAGAVVGGLVGVVDTLFGMGRAAKQARQEFLAFIDAQEMFIAQQRMLVGDITKNQFDILQLQQAFDEQRAPIEKEIEKILANRKTIEDQYRRMGKNPDEYRAKELADLQSRLNTLNDLERRRVEELEKGARAIGKMTDAAAALSNVPTIWKVNLARWRAANDMDDRSERTRPGPGRRGFGRGSTMEETNLSEGGGGGLVVYGDVHIQTAAKSGSELWKELSTVAKRESLRVTGTTRSWQRSIV